MKFSELYDAAFPETKIEIKTKNLLSPWLTKGLRKSSKRKKKLYGKFLKKRNLANEMAYKKKPVSNIKKKILNVLIIKTNLKNTRVT